MGRRRTLSALAGLLVVAVALVSLRAGGDDESTDVATDDDRTTTTSTTSTSTSTSTSAMEPTTVTTAGTVPDRTGAVTSAEPGSAARYEPLPGTAPLNEDGGSVRAYGDGVGVRVGRPATVAENERFELQVEAYAYGDPSIQRIYIWFSDGIRELLEPSCAEQATDPWTTTLTHEYAEPGTYDVIVELETGPGCGGNPPTQVARGRGHLDVTEVVTNGPAEPTATVDEGRRNEDGTVTYTVTVGDDDGLVDDVWVWFDERVDAHHELWGYDDCPDSNQGGWRTSARSFDVTHDFTGESGTFRVEVHSRGCDHEHDQSTTETFVNDVP